MYMFVKEVRKAIYTATVLIQQHTGSIQVLYFVFWFYQLHGVLMDLTDAVLWAS